MNENTHTERTNKQDTNQAQRSELSQTCIDVSYRRNRTKEALTTRRPPESSVRAFFNFCEHFTFSPLAFVRICSPSPASARFLLAFRSHLLALLSC